MPLYEYECEACHHRFEVIQKFSDPPLETCPKCGSPVHKLQSAPAFHLKGTGWYVTDYAKKDQGGAAKADDGKSEGKSEGKSDGKNDGKNHGKKSESSDSADKSDTSQKSDKAAKSDKPADSSSSGSAPSPSTSGAPPAKNS